MKYVIEFSKTGIICYTSHLDIMKVFKRSFKRAGISLAYSQGFNPHPKMGFAQPLSLGYEALEEYIEFETDPAFDAKKWTDAQILDEMRALMPEGLELKSIKRNEEMNKTLAADTDAASYTAVLPLGASEISLSGSELRDKYMGQDQIITLKKQKQKKKKGRGKGKGNSSGPVMVELDIKPKIRNIECTIKEQNLVIDMILDSGSISNLSPELVITTIIECFGLNLERSDISVTRNKIYFQTFH